MRYCWKPLSVCRKQGFTRRNTQQAIHLALPVLENKNPAFSMVDLLTEAKSFAAEGTSFTDWEGNQCADKRGDLLYVDVARLRHRPAGFPCVV